LNTFFSSLTANRVTILISPQTFARRLMKADRP